jgi:hypothetical protein
LEVSSTTELEKTEFDERQIAKELNKPLNLPLAVLGVVINPVSVVPKTDIINQSNTVKKPKKIMEENKKNILPIIAVFLLTAGLASLIFWYVVNRNNSENIETPLGQNGTQTEPTIAPEPTLEPTPTISVNVDKAIKIQVLNATEINGQAATLKAKLTALGFTSIAVGNAADNLVANQVKMKPEFADYQSYFEGEMDTYFPATYTDDLKETSTYDVVFYIGTDLSETITSTSTATSTAAPTVSKKLTPTVSEEE